MRGIFFLAVLIAIAAAEARVPMPRECEDTAPLIEVISDNFESKSRLMSEEGKKWLQKTIDDGCLESCSVEQLKAFKGISEPVGPAKNPGRRAPLGEEELVDDLGNEMKVESIRRQHFAEETLANNAYQVIRQPKASKVRDVSDAYQRLAHEDNIRRTRDPDIMLGPDVKSAKIFDIISFGGGKLEYIWKGIMKKVDPENRQTRRIVLNVFEDKEFSQDVNSVRSLKEMILKHVSESLNTKKAPLIDQLIAIVNKNGQPVVVPVFP